MKEKHKAQCNCPDPNCILKTSCGVGWLDKAFEEYEEALIGNEDVLAMRNILPLKKQILALFSPAEGELMSEFDVKRIAHPHMTDGQLAKLPRVPSYVMVAIQEQYRRMIAQGYVKLPDVDRLSNMLRMIGSDKGYGIRAEEPHRIIESPLEGFDFDEVIVEGDCVPVQFGLCSVKCTGGAHSFLCLLSESLCQPRGNMKFICAPMDGINVCELGAEVLSLPEEVYEILRGIMTEVQEINERSLFAFIEVIEVDTGCSPHCLGVLVCLNHALESYHIYRDKSILFQEMRNWLLCLNTKVQESCRISAGLVDIPMKYRQEIHSYARIHFEETRFGCIYFEVPDEKA